MLQSLLTVHFRCRDFFGLRLTGPTAQADRPLLKPIIRLVGNSHGDEVTTVQLLLGLSAYLVARYSCSWGSQPT